MPKSIARLIGLGAYAASVGFVALFLLVAYVSRHTATGGMDSMLSHVTWLSLGGVTLALVAGHHVIGRQLLLIARVGDAPQPLGGVGVWRGRKYSRSFWPWGGLTNQFWLI